MVCYGKATPGSVKGCALAPTSVFFQVRLESLIARDERLTVEAPLAWSAVKTRQGDQLERVARKRVSAVLPAPSLGICKPLFFPFADQLKS